MTEISVEAAGKVDVKQMSKTERRELRRIVARRFRMLRDQLYRRENELSRAIANQIREEKKASIRKIESRLKPLLDRQNKLHEAFQKVYEEASTLGVQINISTPAPAASLTAFRANYGRPPVSAVTNDEIRERMNAIKEQAGWGKLSLNEMEWQLDEQLAVGELESGTANQFLESLPSAETLLPLPDGLKLPEIEAGDADFYSH